MPVDDKLIDLLCCPVTKVPVRRVQDDELQKLNAAAEAGTLRYVDDSSVEKTLQEGLITEDRVMVYEVRDDIPVMLAEKGIPTRQLEGF